MFKVDVIQTRPNTSLPFFYHESSSLVSDAFRDYFVETYMDSCVSIDSIESEDGLQLVVTTVWVTEEALLAFQNDQNQIDNFTNVWQQYCNDNGITFEIGDRTAV